MVHDTLHTHELSRELSGAVADWQEGLCAGSHVHAALHRVSRVLHDGWMVLRGRSRDLQLMLCAQRTYAGSLTRLICKLRLLSG